MDDLSATRPARRCRRQLNSQHRRSKSSEVQRSGWVQLAVAALILASHADHADGQDVLIPNQPCFEPASGAVHAEALYAPSQANISFLWHHERASSCVLRGFPTVRSSTFKIVEEVFAWSECQTNCTAESRDVCESWVWRDAAHSVPAVRNTCVLYGAGADYSSIADDGTQWSCAHRLCTACDAIVLGVVTIKTGTRDADNGGSVGMEVVLFSDDLEETYGPISIGPFPGPIEVVNVARSVPTRFLRLSKFRLQIIGDDGWSMDYIELSTSLATLRVDTDLWFDESGQDYPYDAPVYEEYEWACGANADVACCTNVAPCGLNEGNCNQDSHCEGDLVCDDGNCVSAHRTAVEELSLPCFNVSAGAEYSDGNFTLGVNWIMHFAYRATGLIHTGSGRDEVFRIAVDPVEEISGDLSSIGRNERNLLLFLEGNYGFSLVVGNDGVDSQNQHILIDLRWSHRTDTIDVTIQVEDGQVHAEFATRGGSTTVGQFTLNGATHPIFAPLFTSDDSSPAARAEICDLTLANLVDSPCNESSVCDGSDASMCAQCKKKQSNTVHLSASEGIQDISDNCIIPDEDSNIIRDGFSVGTHFEISFTWNATGNVGTPVRYQNVFTLEKVVGDLHEDMVLVHNFVSSGQFFLSTRFLDDTCCGNYTPTYDSVIDVLIRVEGKHTEFFIDGEMVANTFDDMPLWPAEHARFTGGGPTYATDFCDLQLRNFPTGQPLVAEHQEIFRIAAADAPTDDEENAQYVVVSTRGAFPSTLHLVTEHSDNTYAYCESRALEDSAIYDITLSLGESGSILYINGSEECSITFPTGATRQLFYNSYLLTSPYSWPAPGEVCGFEMWDSIPREDLDPSYMPPPTPACDVRDNVDAEPGSFQLIPNAVTAGVSVEDCCKICSSFQECVGAPYDPITEVCWPLKGDVRWVASSNRVTVVPKKRSSPCLSYGHYNLPYNSSSGVLPAATWEECQALCLADAACGAWVWRNSAHAESPLACSYVALPESTPELVVDEVHLSCLGLSCITCDAAPPSTGSEVYCDKVKEDLGGACVDTSERFGTGDSDLYYGFELRAPPGGFLAYGDASFGDSLENDRAIAAINVCILSLYGNFPDEIPFVPNDASFFLRDNALPTEPHWYHECDEGACSKCSNSARLTAPAGFTFNWNTKFSKGDACDGSRATHRELPTRYVRCLFAEADFETYPTPMPTSAPTPMPTSVPTPLPTPNPTAMPTPNPTATPSPAPTLLPTPNPTRAPTGTPTSEATTFISVETPLESDSSVLTYSFVGGAGFLLIVCLVFGAARTSRFRRVAKNFSRERGPTSTSPAGTSVTRATSETQEDASHDGSWSEPDGDSLPRALKTDDHEHKGNDYDTDNEIDAYDKYYDIFNESPREDIGAASSLRDVEEEEVQQVGRPGEPFKCKTCEEWFRGMNQLRTHMMTVHGESKFFNCPICDKKFERKWLLRIHKLTHTNEMPYKCSLCEKGFKQRSNLTRHMTNVHKTPFKCPKCPLRFALAEEVNAHLLDVHGMQPMQRKSKAKGKSAQGSSRRTQRRKGKGAAAKQKQKQKQKPPPSDDAHDGAPAVEQPPGMPSRVPPSNAGEGFPRPHMDSAPTVPNVAVKDLDAHASLGEHIRLQHVEALVAAPRMEFLGDSPRMEALKATPRMEALVSTPRMEALEFTPRMEALEPVSIPSLREESRKLSLPMPPIHLGNFHAIELELADLPSTALDPLALGDRRRNEHADEKHSWEHIDAQAMFPHVHKQFPALLERHDNIDSTLHASVSIPSINKPSVNMPSVSKPSVNMPESGEYPRKPQLLPSASTDGFRRDSLSMSMSMSEHGFKVPHIGALPSSFGVGSMENFAVASNEHGFKAPHIGALPSSFGVGSLENVAGNELLYLESDRRGSSSELQIFDHSEQLLLDIS